MALNTSKCNCLTQLHFKGLKYRPR